MLYKTIRKVNNSDISDNKLRDFDNEHPSSNNELRFRQTSKQMYDGNDADGRKSTVSYFYLSFITCSNMAKSAGGGSLTITSNINYS